MEIKEIEQLVIACIRQNIEDSDEEVPDITPTTGVFTGIAGFDSLRAIEVLVSLEDMFSRELSPENVFVKKPPGSDRVCDIANAIKAIVDEGAS
jgi:acyl carrier protein